MTTLTNCQVLKVFHIPKLRYPCHKFKLLYQENVWFRCYENKNNICLYISKYFLWCFQPLHWFHHPVFSKVLRGPTSKRKLYRDSNKISKRKSKLVFSFQNHYLSSTSVLESTFFIGNEHPSSPLPSVVTPIQCWC